MMNFFSNQHSLYSTQFPDADINIDSAWNIETGEPYIKVGVFDSGIDATHPDLDVLGGYYYEFNPNDSFLDTLGHGTRVAGIIGAKRNNANGVAGVAGGNNLDEEGVSVLSFKIGFKGADFSVEVLSAGVIDAARSVGTYYDWSSISNEEDLYFNHTSGFGIHVGNHSYKVNINATSKDSELIEVDDWGGWIYEIKDCDLCRESFLFSFNNHVINVVSSGNGTADTNTVIERYIEPYVYPQNYDDSWTILVGASDYNGNTKLEFEGGSNSENLFYSIFSDRLDVIAPGTDTIVYTTSSQQDTTAGGLYYKMNGTSAAAPHVSGLVGLLLSHYNQNCYSPSNLAIEDVEYILEKSAVDKHSLAYDDTSGFGLIDATAALKMIDYPKFQILHPSLPIDTTIIEVDTIHFRVNQPLANIYEDPYSQNFFLESNQDYKVERHKITRTFSYDGSLPQYSEILDVWLRKSSTNLLNEFIDTFYYQLNLERNTPGVYYIRTTTEFDNISSKIIVQ